MPKTYTIKVTFSETEAPYLEFQSDGPETEDRTEVYKHMPVLETEILQALVKEWNEFQLS